MLPRWWRAARAMALPPGGEANANIVKVLRRKCDDLEEQLDAENDAKTEAITAKAELEEELSSLRKELEAERQVQAKRRERIRRAEEALEQEHLRLEQARQQLARLGSDREAALERLHEVQASIQAAQQAEGESRDRTCRAEEALLQEHSRLEQARQQLARLGSEREAALERLQEAERGRDAEEQQQALLMRQLEHELLARSAEAERHQELKRQHDRHENVLSQQQQRFEVLAAELSAERSARAAEGVPSQSEELGRRIEALLGEGERLRSIAGQLERDLQAERHERVADAARHKESQDHCEQLRGAGAHSREEAAWLAAELGAERQRHAAEEAACAELEANLEQAQVHLNTSATARANVEADLEEASRARDEERRRVMDLQARFNAVQPEHEDLFARYSEVVEQIDMLKGEKHKLVLESLRLRASIADQRGEANEARRQKEDAEAAPPSQIAVSDVLISVRLDDATAPLELRPWDTNFESVVAEWLAAEHKAAELQKCLVRYLHHLEDTADAFPVRAEAKLQEVHEQFAV